MVGDAEFGLELRWLSDRVALVCVSGEIDIYTAPRLKDTMAGAIDASAKHLLLDFGKVGFIDSIGLSVLVAAAKRLKACDQRLALAGVNAEIQGILEITRLVTMFKTYPTLEAALDDLIV